MEDRVEAEVKRALTAAEATAMPARLAALGFTPTGEEAQQDYYLRFTPAERGYDFTRLRRTADGAWLTEKRWGRDAAGEAIRLEAERAVDPVAAAALLRDYPEALLLEKTRRIFTGTVAGHAVTCDLDRVTLRGATTHYIEAEIITPAAHAHSLRTLLAVWLADTLDIPADRDAPSMLELLLAARQ
jgi:adenylate cyclase class IV